MANKGEMANNGIIVNGGNFTSVNTLVGHGSIVSDNQQIDSAGKSLGDSLEQLLQAIKDMKTPIQDKDDIMEAVNTMKAESEKEIPSKITLKGIGQGIIETLEHVKELAPYATTIWDKIAAL